MSITESAITNNRVTGALVILLFLAGIQAFIDLPKAQDPGYIVRTAVITTRFPGASPERVELLVTDKIEKKAQEMPEVDSITSSSRTGISIINVNFKESYKEMRPIFDDLRRKVDDIVGDLPDEVRDLNINDEFGDVFGSVYALTGDGYSHAELETIANEFRDRLLNEPDIAKVSLHGLQQERLFVDYNNAQLTDLGLSPQQLSNILESVNILSSGGDIVSGRERIVLEPSGNLESLDDLRRTVIQLPNGDVVYLGDIVEVYRDYQEPPESITRVNGQPAVAIAISTREGGDVLKLGERLDILIPEISKKYPWGIELEKIWFQADLVEKSVNGFLRSLSQAIAIVIVVMVFFLGIRTGLVVALLIPTTMLITFFVMQFFDITVNQISLAALIISLGLLVDNAIVVVESVLLKREQGENPIQAAINAGTELRLPLLISSLTTAAAFMPIGLAESAVGEYTADIFYVVTIALLLSWLLAMTVIPMLTTKLIKVGKKTADEGPSRWQMRYRKLLLLSLRHKPVFLVVVVATFSLSVWGLAVVPEQFIAPSNDPVISGKLELPLGTSIETSRATVEALDKFISQEYYEVETADRLVANWLVFTGEGGPRFKLSLDPPNQNPSNSFLIINTIDSESVDVVIAGIQNYIDEKHPDLEHQLARLENGPPVGYPIQIRLSGPQFEDLYKIAAGITAYVYALDGVSSVKNTWGLQTKKLVVDIDQERALRAGVTSSDVAYSLRAGLSGIELTEYREGDKLIPITLRTVETDRQDISKLDGLNIYSQSSRKSVPLKQVADAFLTFEPGVIERRDRVRTITLQVQLLPWTTPSEVNSGLIPWLDESSQYWPVDYEFEIGGETETSDDANASIIAKVPLAAFVIVLLLIAQFNSVRRPIIILATIPLGLIGVTFGLHVAQSSMGFFTILGIIALSGIIINNAIVLMDRVRIEIEEKHKAPDDALITACMMRLRPIALTMATTVLGMMPLWWGGTPMFEPLAVSIIFGLFFATLLTLLVVPVLYAVLFRVSFSQNGTV